LGLSFFLPESESSDTFCCFLTGSGFFGVSFLSSSEEDELGCCFFVGSAFLTGAGFFLFLSSDESSDESSGFGF